MNKYIIRIMLGMFAGVLLFVISTMILVYATINAKIGRISVFLPFALFFTYEYLIINFLKGDLFSEERKNKDKNELTPYMYFSISSFRFVVKVFQGICIVVTPILWGLSILFPVQ